MVLTFLYLNVIHYTKYKEAIDASSEAWLTEYKEAIDASSEAIDWRKTFIMKT